MIDIGIAVVGGVLFLLGQYKLAFWLIVLAIISGLGAVVKAVINPSWYAEKREEAGLETDFFNLSKHIASLIVTKAIVVLVLAFIAWYLGAKAGYF